MASSKIYYGWPVLAASMASELLATGATAYAAGLFVLPLQGEFHISRAAANSAILFLYCGTMIAAPIVGRALDRFPIRAVMAVGAVIFCITFAAISVMSSPLAMALMLLVPGAVAFIAVGPVNTSTLAARWFTRRRGLALGIAAVATSGGALVVTPLLARAIRDHGWRVALQYEAAIIPAIMILLALLVIRDRPSSVGLENHPENQGDGTPAQTALSWSAILSRRDFWIPSLTLITSSGLSQAVVTTLPPYGMQMGLVVTQAAALISAFGLAAALTKIGAGLLADRLPARPLLGAACVLMAGSQLLLLLVPSYAGLTGAAALAGASMGCAMPTAGRMLAEAFGASHFGAVMGWTYGGMSASAISATLFIGHVYDAAHSYGAAFLAFLAVTALVFLIAVFLKPDMRTA